MTGIIEIAKLVKTPELIFLLILFVGLPGIAVIGMYKIIRILLIMLKEQTEKAYVHTSAVTRLVDILTIYMSTEKGKK
ncbi:MAG TPA: hypothetical protein VMX17_08345 [Candidatus Glassbacteria bacterium]|nr:hypothetical protein [Candidatus Glassbacteria bacterium]